MRIGVDRQKNRQAEAATQKNIRRIFLSLLPVQAFSAGLPAVNSLVDSLLIGNCIGTDALAAIGLYNPMLMLVSAIRAMITSGAQLLCGQAMGRADKSDISRVYTCSIFASILLNIPILLLAELLPGTLAGWLGAGEATMALTTDYIRGIGMGYIFSCLVGCLLPFLQMEKDNRATVAVIIVMMVFNIGGNLLNIFVFQGGMFGIGLATAISNLAAFLVAVALISKSQLFKLNLSSLKLKGVYELCHEGFPAGEKFLCLMIRNRVLNSFVMIFGGTVALSAMTVATDIKEVFGNLLQEGYEGAGRMVACVLAGQRDSSTLRDLPGIMVKNSWWMFWGLYLVVFIFAGPLALLFGADPVQLGTYKLILRLFNLWYLTDALKTPPLCIYEGMGKVKLMMVLTLINELLVPVTVCYTLGNAFGLPAVVSCNIICEIVLMMVMAGIFWARAKRPPRSILELAYIPSTLSAPREDRYKTTIRTVEEATAASQEVIEFCLQHHLPKRTAVYCGLCVEEMTVDTIWHGFKNREDAIDVRILAENGHIRMVLRDTGREFSPIDWLALCKPEDKSRGIGIQMVSKMASEMDYVNTLGMNLLTIVV